MLYYLVGVLIALAVGVLLYGLGRRFQPADEVEARLELWVPKPGEAEDGTAGGRASLLGRVDQAVNRQSFATVIRHDLARADLSLTVVEYLAMRLLVLLLAFVLGYFAAGSLLVGILMAVIGYAVPIVYLRVRQRRRLTAFDAQLPDVLDHLVGSLRAGYGFLQAVEWIGRRVPAPAGAEFQRVIREVQLGWSLTDALDNMVRRIPSDDLALIVTAIRIQYEVGGSLAEILETVAHTIRERVRINREINVLTAQQRYSGYVLIIMPIALAIVLLLINPEYELQLFAPGPTLCIPIGTLLMMLFGFVLMRRIVNIDI